MSLADFGVACGDRLGRPTPAVLLLRPIWSRVLRTAYGRRGLPWSVNGEPLRIDPQVRHLIPRENEALLFQFLRDHLRQGDVVLDVGSFLGTYAIMAARWTGAAGRVLAFEPSPSSFAILQRHLLMNGLDRPRVLARCAALGACQDRRALVMFDDEPYRNMVAASAAPAGSLTSVDVVTIDEVCAEFGRAPDWIRMDVQGLEFDVLRGARAVLHEARGRIRIVAEMHPDQWPDYGIAPHEAAERLAALGLRARSVASGRNPFEQGAHAIVECL